MKAIVQNNIVIDGPKSWNNTYYSKKMYSYGFSVSFPTTEPLDPMLFGDIKLLPVENIYPTPFDSSTEEYTGPTVEVLENSVVLTYGKQDKPPAPPPEPSPLPIEDATGIGDITEKYNLLIIELRERGLIKS